MSHHDSPTTSESGSSNLESAVPYWLVGLGILGCVIGGLMVIVPDEYSSTMDAGFQLFVISAALVVIGSFIISAQGRKAAKAQRIEQEFREARERHHRLKRLQESMTPAEWETYKVQLENQRLLQELRDRQSQPRMGMGVGFIVPMDNNDEDR